ncbi:hypothetical protein QC760_005982 [Botrytis cinerea]
MAMCWKRVRFAGAPHDLYPVVLPAKVPEHLTSLVHTTALLQAVIPIICILCRLIEIGKREDLLGGARTAIVAELSDSSAHDVVRVGNRGQILSLSDFWRWFFLMISVSNELAIHRLAKPEFWRMEYIVPKVIFGRVRTEQRSGSTKQGVQTSRL